LYLYIPGYAPLNHILIIPALLILIHVLKSKILKNILLARSVCATRKQKKKKM